MKLRNLFWSFLKLAPVTFGGGYALFPAIETEFVERQKAVDAREMKEMLSIASAAPGGAAMNASMMVGYRLAGWKGALAASLGMVLPPFVIVLVLLHLYRLFVGSDKFHAALQGISWAVVGLILVSALRMGRSAIVDKLTLSLAGAGFVLLLIGLHPIIIIIAGLVAGYSVYLIHPIAQHKLRWGAKSYTAFNDSKQAAAPLPERPEASLPDAYMYFI